MKKREITAQMINAFSAYLVREEKSENTVAKYLRDVRAFAADRDGVEITKGFLCQFESVFF